MHDLQLVGVHDDGEHLVLSDRDGQRYLLPVDEALRAAVRRDRAHLGQAQNEANGKLRPREVQARVRAGMDAESIATAAGWPVEKVRRFEGPVLAERAHMAQLAREVRLRRRAGEPVTLDAEVTHRLVERGVDPDKVSWDSWRGDDGPWTVAVEFSAGGRDRRATWQFDLAARSVVPADDEARWLSEQSPGGTDGPLSAARLATIPAGSVYDIEADGGVTAGRQRPGAGNTGAGNTGVGHAADGAPGREPVDLMSAMRSRRRERANPAHPAGRREPVREGLAPTDVPGPTHPTRRPPPTPPQPAPPAAAPATPGSRLDVREEEPPSGASDGTSPENGPPRSGKTKARRASVPSWDDIMFGAKRD